MRQGQLHRQRRGLTLAEVLVVVFILGLLAALAFPSYAHARRKARQVAFACDLKVFTNAFELHKFRTGVYPPPADPGVCPPEMTGYFDTSSWTRPTPVGGLWDWFRDEYDVDCAVGVDFDVAGQAEIDQSVVAYMTEVDAGLDDGRLATGMFILLHENRYGHLLRD
jgi:prepilin-type N-terminal cleavage/methylation domain-containing protein